MYLWTCGCMASRYARAGGVVQLTEIE